MSSHNISKSIGNSNNIINVNSMIIEWQELKSLLTLAIVTDIMDIPNVKNRVSEPEKLATPPPPTFVK